MRLDSVLGCLLIIAGAGCAVTDEAGVTIEHRGDEQLYLTNVKLTELTELTELAEGAHP